MYTASFTHSPCHHSCCVQPMLVDIVQQRDDVRQRKSPALFVQFPARCATPPTGCFCSSSCGYPTRNFRTEAAASHAQHGISNLSERRRRASTDTVQFTKMVTKSKNPMVATTAGAIAGGIETLTIWPMEMIKTNLQLGTMRAQYTGMIGGFRYHVQTDGVGSLYRDWHRCS